MLGPSNRRGIGDTDSPPGHDEGHLAGTTQDVNPIERERERERGQRERERERETRD